VSAPPLRSVALAALGLALAAAGAAAQTVTIQRPGPGAREVAAGQRVALEADLAGGASGPVRWSSSLEGDLGRGRRLRTRRLRPGVHVIAAAAGGLTDRVVLHVDGWGAGDPYRRLLAVLPRSVAARAAGPPDLQDPDAWRWSLKQLPHYLLGDPIALPPTQGDMVEANPTAVHAALGHGGLTAGVSAEGTLSLLRWPGPASLDHVDLQATDYAEPRLGTRPDQGVFCGLRWTDAAGASGTTWLRDAPWQVRAEYAARDADTVVTTFTHAGLGLEVVQTDVVDPDVDVLARRVEVRPLAGSRVVRVRVLAFANLAPCTRQVPFLPYADTILDALNGFATLYDPADDAVLAARPETPAPAEARAVAAAGLQGGPAAARAAAEALARDLDARLGPGVVLALGGDARSDAVQVGVAGAADPSPARADDPWLDAADGDLAGRGWAFGRGAAALARDLDVSAGPRAWTLFLAAGPTADGPDGARTALADARRRGFAAIRRASEARWRVWLARGTLPNAPPGRGVDVLRRGLIATRTATDAASGAIVASVAGQLPYAFDWPRDGAFIDHMLDLAGYPDMVERHKDFTARVQRQGGLFSGTYAMNYAADGTPGGPWLLEIDNAGTACWSFYDHATFIADPADRRAYLRRVMPAIARTADFFVRWRDPFSGLPLPANEDDTPVLSQGLQGSSSGVMALAGAVAAGRAIGHDPAAVARWERRRRELVAAIERRWGEPDRIGPLQPAATSGGRLQSADVRGMAWVLWPADMLANDPVRERGHAAALLAEEADFLALTPGVHGYDAEPLIRVAIARRGDPVGLAPVRRGMRILLEDVPTPGTDHYAEAYRLERTPAGGVRFTNLNDAPHVWEHTLVYLLARELYGP